MRITLLLRSTALAATLALSVVPSVHAADPAQALADVGKTVLSVGPNGEKPEPASAVSLTDAELAEIKGMNAKAAIVMHYAGNDWSQAQIEGLKSQFEKMGISVVAVTDAGFKPDKQVADIETVMAQKPNIIVSIPTDPTATAAAYKAAGEAGAKLVFMDNVPAGFKAGTDYVSSVSADNYGNGVATAHLLAQALGGKGDVGLVFHAADFFVTKQRYDAVKKTLAENYPDIKVVAEQGIGGPDFAGDAEKAAGALLVSNPSIKGIWAVWDVPAEGVVNAALNNGRDDLVIVNCDLGENAAINMAGDGPIKGLSAQRPFDQGVTEAMLAGYGLLNKPAPAYVALPALPVTKANLAEAWSQVYHKPVTDKIKQSME
ncbi:substrate-binding domain-containing protein [Aureimonas pseudogalii]|uniref:Ribose transport system substrate-binding protein n=1 Tax=Aureimonas pseudogalii TaxID=1744844 RepID=A0A7W6MLY6_9HYPH|nr:substrate-binding domain-containing protein [Aureimonas pseudogalii]MBB4000288.1 ribose transport system substrate-binding protein [Aureimonas pseudogalii]